MRTGSDRVRDRPPRTADGNRREGEPQHTVRCSGRATSLSAGLTMVRFAPHPNRAMGPDWETFGVRHWFNSVTHMSG
jgi:hypothetical protein